MRIGISCYPTHGGSGVVATELGLRLAERGHSVAFVSYSAPLRLGVLPPRVCFHEVAIEEYPLLKQFPYTLALASKLAEVARSHRLRILHVHYAIPFAAAAILAKQIAPELDLKVVTTLHGTDITLVGSNDSFRPVTAFCIERSDAVTAVSYALRAETKRVFGITRPIEVIPNFVDPGHYRNAQPARWPGDERGRCRWRARAGDRAHLELPAGQARHRRGPRVRAGGGPNSRRGWCWSATVPILGRPPTWRASSACWTAFA